MLDLNECYNMDCLDGLKELDDNSVDLVVTDPPYGYGFMSKSWDKALVSIDKWEECLRVLKPGAFAFIMSAPRQDVLSRMIVNIGNAGFKTDFTSIYWTYFSGFPKAMNIGKAIDKKMGAEREVIGRDDSAYQENNISNHQEGQSGNYGFKAEGSGLQTAPTTPEAEALDGSFAGFQPKPAVEIVIVAMKPLAENSYVDQALANGHGITWLDDCRIPIVEGVDDSQLRSINRSEKVGRSIESGWGMNINQSDTPIVLSETGRVMANILVCDDVLNDGKNHPAGSLTGQKRVPSDIYGKYDCNTPMYLKGNSVDSPSRYFDLDAWWDERLKSLDPVALKTFPFLLVPKASVSEKSAGLEDIEAQYMDESRKVGSPGGTNPRNRGAQNTRKNFHPTVKPVKLFTYLITLGSRKGDVIIDPFGGSGTTGISAEISERNYILFEMKEDFHKIACRRIEYQQKVIKKSSTSKLSKFFKMK